MRFLDASYNWNYEPFKKQLTRAILFFTQNYFVGCKIIFYVNDLVLLGLPAICVFDTCRVCVYGVSYPFASTLRKKTFSNFTSRKSFEESMENWFISKNLYLKHVKSNCYSPQTNLRSWKNNVSEKYLKTSTVLSGLHVFYL